ncbi:class I SAM-dependent methyltransferase [Geobacter sp.]|uniref:class I SAM-dependent methyltransferase n=1 Tax=Geobacter sp. TaxID=46610 RepID=UPI0027B8A6DF|nr:class I SAM-dependent methyltransferase [Geobacter sp.]
MPHDFDGKKYEKASAHQKEWGSTIIAELCLTGNERVLDLGCGDGVLTSQIADLLPCGEVVGIDASQGMIDVACEKKRRNLNFLLKDIEDMDFVEEFDLIFSNAALHWIKDHEKLLRNVKRALREGGKIRFNFAGDGNCSHFFRVVRESMKKSTFQEYFQNFEWPWYMPSVMEYTSTVGRIGLKNIRVRGENADRYFPDTQAMVNWVDQPSLVPFLAMIADADKEEFRDIVISRMIEETMQEDGRCFEIFRRIDVIAEK